MRADLTHDEVDAMPRDLVNVNTPLMLAIKYPRS
jgi:hypothetical protein